MAENAEIILPCRYCRKVPKKPTVICEFCGFNSETGLLTDNFKPKQAAARQEDGTKAPGSPIKAMVIVFLMLTAAGFLTYKFFPSLLDLAGKIPILGIMPKKMTPEMIKLDKRNEKRKSFLVVEGIAFDAKGTSFVTLNGEVFSQGQKYKEIKVVKINRDSVELLVEGKSVVLGLSDSLPLAPALSLKEQGNK